MKISAKLTLGFSVVFVAVIAIIILGVGAMRDINKEVDVLVEKRIPNIQTANNIIDAVNLQARMFRDILIAHTPEQVDLSRKRIETASQTIADNEKILFESINDEKGKELIKTYKDRSVKFVEEWKKMIALALKEDSISRANALDIMYGSYLTVGNAYLLDIANLVKYEEQLQDQSVVSANNEYSNSTNTMYVLGAVIALLIIVILILTLRSITKPLKEAVNAANDIANGKVDINLNTNKNDEVGVLLKSMSSMAVTLKNVVTQLNDTAEAAIHGKLDKRADATQFKGQYSNIMNSFNKTLDAVIGPLNVTAEYIDRISKGDIPPKISDTYEGDFNEIKNNLNNTVDVMNGLIKEADLLITATKNGKLHTRANHSGYIGEWGKLLQAMNELVDSFGKPFDITVKHITDISNGVLPKPIGERFGGDYDTIIHNINNMIENLSIFIQDMKEMERQQDAGDIDFYMVPDKFNGFFKDMVIGVNAQVNSHISVKKRIVEVVTEYGNGNFEAKMEELPGKKIFITHSVNKVRKQLQDITQEVNLMVKNAVDGNLSYRGDAEKFENAYKELISGINKTLEAIVHPISETKQVLQQWANGNLSVLVEGNYVGDHAALKDAIKSTSKQLPFAESIKIFEAIANGDLSQRMKGDYKGDSLKLKNTLNESLDAIEDILHNVAVTVEEVTKGSLQVSDASTALSQGATEQAASLEEITSSMAEISSQTRTNAESANQANILSEDANKAADKGNTEMTSLNVAMNEISEASRNISRIMKVIDEIAFQTNLLALNAAVEAARAGRHGKGFAVVAEEVRNLAARSAAAAKETSEMIENTIKTVENGSMLAARTGEVLEEIRNATIKVSDIVGEIASSSNEQAQGISQINEGLNQIDKVTQTNTASAEESASAAEELSSQATQLKSMINRFQLSAGRMLNSGSAPYVSGSLGSDDILLNTESNYESMVLTGGDSDTSAEDAFFDNPEDIISLDEDDFGKY